MERFIQVLVDGIATGSIYAALALALVLIFRSTGVVNFAQGEMAMFTTFVAWALIDRGLPFWPAFALTLFRAARGAATPMASRAMMAICTASTVAKACAVLCSARAM